MSCSIEDKALNDFHDFLNFHFLAEGTSPPSWIQRPYCQDLRGIFDRLKSLGWSGEKIVGVVHGPWNLSLPRPLVGTAKKRVEDLCNTLLAWDLYLYASGQ